MSTGEPELPDTGEYISFVGNCVCLDGWFSIEDLKKIVKYMEWKKEVE